MMYKLTTKGRWNSIYVKCLENIERNLPPKIRKLAISVGRQLKKN